MGSDIEIYLKEIKCDGMYCILLGVNRVRCEPDNHISYHSACKTWSQHHTNHLNPEDRGSVLLETFVSTYQSVV
jgi:hypothetical protein